MLYRALKQRRTCMFKFSDPFKKNTLKTSNLIVCRPFLPSVESDNYDCNYFFVNTTSDQAGYIKEVAIAYGTVFIERSLYDFFESGLEEIQDKIKVIDDIVAQKEGSEPRVAFLASNDTHVQFMLKISKQFDNYAFIIPSVSYKDEGAAARLDELGEDYIEIHVKDKTCERLYNFNPTIVFSAADYTSDYQALKRVICDRNIPTITLEEGPQDWHIKSWNKGKLIVLNHYRNANIIFSTGPRTFHYIRPKYFATTGNPKMPVLNAYSMPSKPKVLINCNFTYLSAKPSYESKRKIWMESVLRVCKRIGVDYVISRHPRDDSEWPGEPLISSNAFVLKEQLLDCSVCISRFSSVVYEAAAYGRLSIYYNIGLEPMATFQDEIDDYVPCIIDELELEKILMDHINNYPPYIDINRADSYLSRYCCKLDGNAAERIAIKIREISSCSINDNKLPLEKVEYSWNSAERRRTILLDETKNVVIALHENENDKSFKKGIYLAEKKAAEGLHVFLILKKYPKQWSEYKKYEYHQNIEVVLTDNYYVDFGGIRSTELYYTINLKAHKKDICSLKKSLEGMNYRRKTIW